MAKVKRWVRRVHRVAAYLVGLQVLLWIAGGLTFAWVPFDSVVKGGAVLREAAPVALPVNWQQQAGQVAAQLGTVSAVSSHRSAQGPLLRLTTGLGERWLRLSDGALDTRPTAEQVAQFADELYAGSGTRGEARYLDHPETRVLGLVDEMYGRTGIWQVPFDDDFDTRLYFEGDTGRYLTVRNDFWVFYDAMWRLHIMDYEGGEDFNNWLLTVFATVSAVFAVSGIVLMFFALGRAVRSFAG